MIRSVMVLSLIYLALPALYGATIQVPTDYLSIQEAIDASQNGDLIEVSPGTYVYPIVFNGKAVTVKSTSGPEETIISFHNGVPCGAIVYFNNGENEQ